MLTCDNVKKNLSNLPLLKEHLFNKAHLFDSYSSPGSSLLCFTLILVEFLDALKD